MRSRAAGLGPRPRREGRVPRPYPPAELARILRPEGLRSVRPVGGGRVSREARRERRRPEPGSPLGGAGGVRPGRGERLPRPGRRRPARRAARGANLGTAAGEGGRAAELAGSAAAGPAGGAKLGYLRAPARSGLRQEVLRRPGAPAHMDFLRPRPAPGRTAAGGARGGGAAGRLKGQRADRVRALAAPGRAAPRQVGAREGARKERVRVPGRGAAGPRPLRAPPPRLLAWDPAWGQKPGPDEGRTGALTHTLWRCGTPGPGAPPPRGGRASTGMPRCVGPPAGAGARPWLLRTPGGRRAGLRKKRRWPAPPALSRVTASCVKAAGSAFRPGVIWAHWLLVTPPDPSGSRFFARGPPPVDRGDVLKQGRTNKISYKPERTLKSPPQSPPH